MTYRDALDRHQFDTARREVTNDESLSFMDKVRGLANLSVLQKKKAPEKSKFTLGNLFHGLIGAGVGLGIAKGVASKYNLTPGFEKALSTLGAGVGAALNSGLIKLSGDEMSDLPSADELDEAVVKIGEQRRNAFRVGFMRGTLDSDYFEKTGAALLPIPTIPITPTSILSIPKGIASAVTSTGDVVGTTLGAMEAPDPDEEEIAKLQVERELLEERLERLRADKRNRLLRKLLAKRHAKR